MSGFVRQFWPYLLVAAIIHVALAAFLVINLDRGVLVLPDEAPAEAIEATVVDEALVEAELERIQEEERARVREIEAQRVEAERLAEQRQQEEQRLQALQQQREREATQAEADRVRREREATERAAQAERERQAEAERRRQAELARQREAEAEAERKRKAEAEAAERERVAAQRQQQLAQYVRAITGKVEANWTKPDNWPAGTSCTVRVSQIPGGEVIEARVVHSCGDPFLNRSVENAVLRASPLPAPPDPSVFAREIEFVFKPGG
ncbi:MAG: TonB family protein [Gammaproteobacteria bacterium]